MQPKVANPEQLTAPKPAATGPKRHRWTAKEFYRLVEKDFFSGKRVELIEGVIVEMAAQLEPHATSILLTLDALQAAFGVGFSVRPQMTLDLSPYLVPDPDLAVVLGTARDNLAKGTPTSALLIVEVSLSTLSYDRRTKGSLYAKVGIADYWIVNLKRRVLEVRRNPGPNSAAKYGASYLQRIILQPNDTISPLAAPQASIKVADLLP